MYYLFNLLDAFHNLLGMLQNFLVELNRVIQDVQIRVEPFVEDVFVNELHGLHNGADNVE